MTDLFLLSKIGFSNVNMQTWSVTISGFAIVFVVLILLIVIFSVFGKVMDVINKKSAEKKASMPDKAPAADKGTQVSDEVAAVVTAAIAEASGGKNFVIKDIKESAGDK